MDFFGQPVHRRKSHTVQVTYQKTVQQRPLTEKILFTIVPVKNLAYGPNLVWNGEAHFLCYNMSACVYR